MIQTVHVCLTLESSLRKEPTPPLKISATVRTTRLGSRSDQHRGRETVGSLLVNVRRIEWVMWEF